MCNPLELTGQKFGKLTALHIAGKNKCGQLLWKCQCECGNTTVTTASYLRNGHTRSCGCIAHLAKDLTGRTFGKLTVLHRVPKKEGVKKHSAYWMCQCECGRETTVDANSLVTGKTASCGDCSWGSYELTEGYMIGHFEDGADMLIDAADYPLVSKHRWWIDRSSGYFVTSMNGRTLHLHRLLMPDVEGQVCDHINRNKLDNRRNNLRYATPKENSRNRSKSRNNTTGFIGVCWHIRKKKYVAQVKVEGQTHNLGQFDTAEEAARVRDKAALFFFGEFANLNFGSGTDESGNPGACEKIHAARLAV